jgi:gliding motility-associated-like protein
MMKKLLLIISCLFVFIVANSQNFSNKGKDFWLGYGYHCQMNTTGTVNTTTGGSQNMVLYFTSDKNATVTVEIPANGYKQTFTVLANQITETTELPKTGTQDARISDTGYFNRGIHIYSDNDIVAYAHIYNGSISGASLLFPTNTLGKDYYVISYNQITNQAYSNSFAFVVAVEDNTTVEITPSITNKNAKTAGTPFTVNLNKGQIYSLFGTTSGNSGTDLTGTRIRTISTNGACKKIAVFCGAGKMSIGNTQSGSADNLFAQSLPASAWGLKYLTAPTGTQPNNYFRICVTDPSTVVKLNGTPIPTSLLQRNFFYELKNETVLSVPGNGLSVANTANGVWNSIEADKPINVAQFTPTQGADGNGSPGDPEMIYLSPVEQTINNITLNSTFRNAILVHGINVVIKSGGVNSFKLDGVSKSTSFNSHPKDPNYSYAILPVTSGPHTLYSDTGFNAIAYGFGSAESYGYNAGTNIKDLYTPVFQNPYARIDFAATCVGTPFQFSVPLSYKPTSLTWDFGNSTNISPNTNIGPVTPVPDSATIIGGQSLYYYSPANGVGSKSFTYSKAGTDTIKIFATNPTPDGCGTSNAEIVIPVIINSVPFANFSVSAVRCISDSIPFTDASTGLGTSNVVNGLWYWGDGTTDSLKAPKHKFLLPKTYSVRYRPITDFGCIGDTTIAFDLAAAPIANFGTSSNTCSGNTILFKDSSTISVGTIVKWYWDYGNGKKDTLSTNASRSQVYNTAGTYIVNLVVENNTGCKSIAFTKSLVIHPLPITNFVLPSAVCLPVGKSQFTNTTTISDTSTTIKYLWNFGDGRIDSVSSPIHYYSSVGPFNIKLTATSVFGCIKDTTKVLSSVFLQPKANFTVSSEVCLRDSTIYTDASDAKGSVIAKWHWNFGDGNTDTLQNPKHKYLAAGTDTVKLFIITDKGCYSDTLLKTTILNPLPSANFAYAANAYCEKTSIAFTDSSKANAGNLSRWYWLMGDGRVIDTANGNSFNHSYNSDGSYVVKLMVITNKGCKSDTIAKSIKVHPLPMPNFTMPNVVCLPSGAAAFTNTTSISDTSTFFKYLWNFGDGGIDSIKNPTHNFKAVGPYNINLRVTSIFGCIKDTTKVLGTIYPQAKANFTVSPEVCLRDTTIYTDASDGKGSTVTKWNWSFGDTSTDTLQNTSHKYAAAGTYTVSLYTVTDKGCNSDTLTKTTVVNPLPSVGFKYNANFYCETRPVTFTDSSKAGAGNLNRWYWQMGDGRVIDTTNSNPFNHSYAAFGTYTVKLAVQSDKGCKSDTVSKTITINPLPQVGFIVPEICLADAAAQFTDTSKIADGSQASFTYSWNINVTGITPAPTPFTSLTVKNPSAKYFKTDNYQVAETVTSNKGCAVTLQQLFTVNGSIPVPYFAVQNANKLCSNDSVGILDTSYIDFGNITKVDIVWDNVNNPTVKEIDNNPTSGNNKLGKLYKHLYPNFFNPQTAKTYQIKFTAYSGGICVNSITKTITLNPSPRVQFTILPGICNDTVPRQITQATETTGIAGTFVYTGTGVNTTGLFTPNNNPAGTYTIQYKYSSTIGCADSATQPITVWPSPIAKWGISSPTCEKNTITFTDSSVANYKKIKTWAWNYGDGTTATKTDSLPYTYQYAAAGSYNASLRVTTDSGCHSQTNTKIIKVNNLPKVSFTMPTICLPDGNGSFNSTSTIGDNSENLFSYSWNFGDPNNATGGTSQTVSHQYSALPPAGGYPVQLIITSKDGCKDSLTQAYNNVNPQPTAAFTTQPTAVCVRDIISFTDISNGKTSAVSKWYWDVAQGQTSSTQNPSRVFRDSGSYQIRLWVDNAQGCRSDTASQSVTIYPYPILELGPNLVVLEGGTIALKPQIVYGNNLRYAWTVVSPAGSPTYLDSITAAIPKSTPAASVDSLIYKLTLTGIGGCAVTDNVTLVVLKAPIIPNTFSPNGDGQHDRWIIKSLESYPGATIEIYNRNGQIVYKATGYDPNNGWDGTFNGTPLPVGTYYYIINPKNGREILSGSITIIR